MACRFTKGQTRMRDDYWVLEGSGNCCKEGICERFLIKLTMTPKGCAPCIDAPL